MYWNVLLLCFNTDAVVGRLQVYEMKQKLLDQKGVWFLLIDAANAKMIGIVNFSHQKLKKIAFNNFHGVDMNMKISS